MYTLKNLTTTGVLPRKSTTSPAGANAQFSINTPDDILIENCSFRMKGYNCIEIALTAGCAPKNITIKNCNFTGILANNAITIFDTAADAKVIIENCTFIDVSNPIRFSCRSNNTCKVCTLKIVLAQNGKHLMTMLV